MKPAIAACVPLSPEFAGYVNIMDNLRDLQKQMAEIKAKIRAKKKEATSGVGKRMAQFRKSKGITQAELADLLGVTRVQVTNMETRGGMTLETFLMACDILSVSPNELSGYHT